MQYKKKIKNFCITCLCAKLLNHLPLFKTFESPAFVQQKNSKRHFLFLHKPPRTCPIRIIPVGGTGSQYYGKIWHSIVTSSVKPHNYKIHSEDALASRQKQVPITHLRHRKHLIRKFTISPAQITVVYSSNYRSPPLTITILNNTTA